MKTIILKLSLVLKSFRIAMMLHNENNMSLCKSQRRKGTNVGYSFISFCKTFFSFCGSRHTISGPYYLLSFRSMNRSKYELNLKNIMGNIGHHTNVCFLLK